MNEHLDPIDLLREADPIDPHTMPSASLARVSARVQEIIMSDTELTSAPAMPGGRRRIFVGLAGAVATFALIAVFALPRALAPVPQGEGGGVAVLPSPSAVGISEDPPATGAPGEAPASDGPVVGVASCIRYDTTILTQMDLGFDGTVTAVEGDQVTFAVNAPYKGITGTSITLTSPGSGVSLEGTGLDFTVGDHLLVAGSGTTISGCGYTQPYDATVASEWAKAFGG